jgi:hypothetical protein
MSPVHFMGQRQMEWRSDRLVLGRFLDPISAILTAIMMAECDRSQFIHTNDKMETSEGLPMPNSLMLNTDDNLPKLFDPR